MQTDNLLSTAISAESKFQALAVFGMYRKNSVTQPSKYKFFPLCHLKYNILSVFVITRDGANCCGVGWGLEHGKIVWDMTIKIMLQYGYYHRKDSVGYGYDNGQDGIKDEHREDSMRYDHEQDSAGHDHGKDSINVCVQGTVGHDHGKDSVGYGHRKDSMRYEHKMKVWGLPSY